MAVDLAGDMGEMNEIKKRERQLRLRIFTLLFAGLKA
jgi:hypothetical protein